MGIEPDIDPLWQQQAYHEIGNPEEMKYKDKIFVIQRRGGYPYREGYSNSNNLAQLPLDLPNDGRKTILTINVSDDASESEKAIKLKEILLRMVLFSATTDDAIDVSFNGIPLELLKLDETWKDPQIFSPKPLPSQMPAKWAYGKDPDQKLLLLVFRVLSEHLNVGENRVGLRIANRKSYPICTNIKVEKVEVHVKYR